MFDDGNPALTTLERVTNNTYKQKSAYMLLYIIKEKVVAEEGVKLDNQVPDLFEAAGRTIDRKRNPSSFDMDLVTAVSIEDIPVQDSASEDDGPFNDADDNAEGTPAAASVYDPADDGIDLDELLGDGIDFGVPSASATPPRTAPSSHTSRSKPDCVTRLTAPPKTRQCRLRK
jgi:hypothetical protein